LPANPLTVPPTREGEAPLPDDDPDRLFTSLRAFSRATSVPVLARYRHGAGDTSVPLPEGKTTADYLSALTSAGFDHKWSGGALMVRDLSWLREPEGAKLPWEVVKRLREQASSTPHGGLTLDGYLHAATHLTPAQIEGMWNSVGWRLDMWQDMQGVNRLQALFNLLARDTVLKQKALDSGGSGAPVPLPDLPAGLARSLRAQTGGRADSFRLTIQTGPLTDPYSGKSRPYVHLTTVSLLAQDGALVEQVLLPGSPWPLPKAKSISATSAPGIP